MENSEVPVGISVSLLVSWANPAISVLPTGAADWVSNFAVFDEADKSVGRAYVDKPRTPDVGSECCSSAKTEAWDLDP